VAYRVADESSVSFALETRSTKINGRFRVVRGQFDIDLLDLAASRGTLRVDLGSIGVEGDAGTSPEHGAEALNWLDLGSSRPEVERERLRWASFEVDELESPSAASAHGGAGVAARVDAGDGETRRVTFTATGRLSLHDRRAEYELSAEAHFHYDGPADPERRPRISIELRRPMSVRLDTFDVKPRDAHGVLIAGELDRLGRDVARVAKLTAAIELVPE
jgi:polyisoprenoid-binding protein YceI